MGRSDTMSVSLTPHQRRLIQSKLDAGGYHTASEVVREALRLLEERDRQHEEFWAGVRRKVAVARKELRAGRAIPGDEARAEMDAYVHSRVAARKNGAKRSKP
jgi:antitoxin ParD1/3/4